MLRKIQLFTAVLLWLVSFTLYRTLLSHVLYYFDQHHLFIYTRQYIATVWRREGWEGLATDFVSQFFHNEVLGAAVLATILVLIYLSFCSILRSARIWCQKRKDKADARLRVGKVVSWLEILQVPLLLTLFVFFSFTRLEDSVSTLVGYLGTFGFWAVLLRILRRKEQSSEQPRYATYISASVTLLAFLFSGYLFQKNYNIPERIMLKTQQYAEEGDWDNVLEYTSAYLRSGHNNILIAYYHSLALAEKGALTKNLNRALQGESDPAVNYILQMGPQALFFPWRSNSRESEYGSLIYERLGLINEAQHWETEAMQVFGLTAPHLTRLAKYAIATGRPEAAEHFIEPLRHTLFFRGEAAALEGMNAKGEVPGLKNAFAVASDTTKAHFTNVTSLSAQLKYALACDSTNTLAQDYQQTCQILSSLQQK